MRHHIKQEAVSLAAVEQRQDIRMGRFAVVLISARITEFGLDALAAF